VRGEASAVNVVLDVGRKKKATRGSEKVKLGLFKIAILTI